MKLNVTINTYPLLCISQVVRKVNEVEATMENGHGISKLVTKLNPIDSKIIVIASFPERFFLLILQIATAISKIKYITKLNGRGTNTLNTDPIRGIITTKMKTSLYQVLLSNTLLDLECNYINLMLNIKTKGQTEKVRG